MSGRYDEVLRFILLQQEPLHFDEVSGMSPVPFCIEVAEKKATLQADLYLRETARNFSRYGSLTSDWRLVVEKDSVTRVNPVGLAIIHSNPVGVEFRNTIRRARIKWRGLGLGSFPHQTIQLRRRSLVKPNGLAAQVANCLEQPQCSERVDVGGVFGSFE